jgi:hypothetical protein
MREGERKRKIKRETRIDKERGREKEGSKWKRDREGKEIKR